MVGYTKVQEKTDLMKNFVLLFIAFLLMASCTQNKIAFVDMGSIMKDYEGLKAFDEEMEAKAAKVMQSSEFTISCDIGIGKGEFTAYGCDLGHEYVKINADYRT